MRGDGGSRVGEVRAGTTSPMPEHKGFKLQIATQIKRKQYLHKLVTCRYTIQTLDTMPHEKYLFADLVHMLP